MSNFPKLGNKIQTSGSFYCDLDIIEKGHELDLNVSNINIDNKLFNRLFKENKICIEIKVECPSTYTEYVGFVTPCNGYVDYVIIRSETAHGNTVVGLHLASDGTENPSTSASHSVTVNMSADDTPYKFSGGSSWSFVAGQALSISQDVASSSSSGDTMATIVLVLDWNNEDITASGGGGGGSG